MICFEGNASRHGWQNLVLQLSSLYLCLCTAGRAHHLSILGSSYSVLLGVQNQWYQVLHWSQRTQVSLSCTSFPSSHAGQLSVPGSCAAAVSFSGLSGAPSLLPAADVRDLRFRGRATMTVSVQERQFGSSRLSSALLVLLLLTSTSSASGSRARTRTYLEIALDVLLANAVLLGYDLSSSLAFTASCLSHHPCKLPSSATTASIQESTPWLQYFHPLRIYKSNLVFGLSHLCILCL